jgi:hypothetical protein
LACTHNPQLIAGAAVELTRPFIPGEDGVILFAGTLTRAPWSKGTVARGAFHSPEKYGIQKSKVLLKRKSTPPAPLEFWYHQREGIPMALSDSRFNGHGVSWYLLLVTAGGIVGGGSGPLGEPSGGLALSGRRVVPESSS